MQISPKCSLKKFNRSIFFISFFAHLTCNVNSTLTVNLVNNYSKPCAKKSEYKDHWKNIFEIIKGRKCAKKIVWRESLSAKQSIWDNFGCIQQKESFRISWMSYLPSISTLQTVWGCRGANSWLWGKHDSPVLTAAGLTALSSQTKWIFRSIWL